MYQRKTTTYMCHIYSSPLHKSDDCSAIDTSLCFSHIVSCITTSFINNTMACMNAFLTTQTDLIFPCLPHHSLVITLLKMNHCQVDLEWFYNSSCSVISCTWSTCGPRWELWYPEHCGHARGHAESEYSGLEREFCSGLFASLPSGNAEFASWVWTLRQNLHRNTTLVRQLLVTDSQHEVRLLPVLSVIAFEFASRQQQQTFSLKRAGSSQRALDWSQRREKAQIRRDSRVADWPQELWPPTRQALFRYREVCCYLTMFIILSQSCPC